MEMNKTYLVSADTLKTVLQGALGSMTFGAYHQFTTNKIMELNNEKQDLILKINNEKHQIEMNELKIQINKLNNQLNNRKGWWN